jgi:hypothetical protein
MGSILMTTSQDPTIHTVVRSCLYPLNATRGAQMSSCEPLGETQPHLKHRSVHVLICGASVAVKDREQQI